MTLDIRTLDALDLEPRAVAVNHNDHFVELYEDDSSLVASVRTFISMGISDGEAAVVVATPDHREALEAELGRTVDLEAAQGQGLYTSLDAASTLSLFMQGDVVDPRGFERVIGAVLRSAGRDGRKVRVFGEMVAVLWHEGNVAGALQLEDHWNELATELDFRLFCAYPTETFSADDTAMLTGVCNRHSHVIVPAR